MDIVGLICEYNPFHNGHLYHINKIKEMYPNSILILVLSGSVCERGDLSIINKWDKTSIALDHNIDLVVELPFKFSSQSADVFCYGSMKLLHLLGVNKIVFGSESDNIEILKSLAQTQLNNNEYNDKIKSYLKEGYSYPAALSASLNDITGYNIEKPNDILGIGYIREILKNNYIITPITIKRTDDYNNDISSASGIRKLLKEGKDVSNLVPNNTIKYLNNLTFIEDYYQFLKYKILSEKENIIKYQTVDEKIIPRVLEYINNSNSLDELILNIKSKNYTYTKLKRMFIHILFSFTKEEANNIDIDYIRILGFNNKGKEYLHNIKKEIDIPILTNYDNKYLNMELRVSTIIGLLKDNNYYESEYKNNVIKKD